MASICANIIYYIVTPALRGRTRWVIASDRWRSSFTGSTDHWILMVLSWQYFKKWLRFRLHWKHGEHRSLISSMTIVFLIPFPTRLNLGSRWSNHSLIPTRLPFPNFCVSDTIIYFLFRAQKVSFAWIAKVATAPSANIFTNREYEMLLRSSNVRRLSFIIFTGEKNHFLTQLPVIQEKLVDILRNVVAPVVQSEVFLCVRVLLCRLSRHNLTSFWPVLLTELVRLSWMHFVDSRSWPCFLQFRIFEQVMTNLPPDGSEDLQLVLAACKCLDLLITLQTEEFQM